MLKGDIQGLKGLTSSTQNPTVSDIAGYHLSVMQKQSGVSKLYSELAIINSATLLIKDGKPLEAQGELAKIDQQSPVYNIATIIKHYTIKGK